MNNSTRVHLPPIQDMLYSTSSSFQPPDVASLHKKPPSSHSPTLSYSAPYPRVPDLESQHGHHRKSKIRGHQDTYHHPLQIQQYSSDYYNYDQLPSPYHQRDGTEYIKLIKVTPNARTDWEERSADYNGKQNGYTGYSKMDEASATNISRNRAAEPLQQQQQQQFTQRVYHSRSFSDQFLQQDMRRSSASESVATYQRNPNRSTCSVDPPSNFHRRAASDISSLNNRKRRSSSSSSSIDQHIQDKDGHLPPPNKIISANRYKCNECLKTFSRPSSLRIHILSHTGEKPHICPQPDCGRRFSVQSNMRRHLKVHYCNNNISPQQRQQQHQTQQTFSSRLQ